MISVPKAVIDIDAMMIEFLNTFTANHTMKGPSGFNDFAIEAEILQINVPFIAYL